MFATESPDCAQFLLNLICYEIRRQKLSPEMGLLLETHLRECPACRKGLRSFVEMLRPQRPAFSLN